MSGGWTADVPEVSVVMPGSYAERTAGMKVKA